MSDRPATARVLLALQDEVDRLRELLDAKSHEAGLYARRMEQAQRSRDEARAEERAAVVAYLVRCGLIGAAEGVREGDHRLEGEER